MCVLVLLCFGIIIILAAFSKPGQYIIYGSEGMRIQNARHASAKVLIASSANDAL